MNIVPSANQQFSLSANEGSRSAGADNLMETLDTINQRYGRGTLRLAAEGIDRSWQMRRGHLSPGYTTSWEGLPLVSAK